MSARNCSAVCRDALVGSQLRRYIVDLFVYTLTRRETMENAKTYMEKKQSYRQLGDAVDQQIKLMEGRKVGDPRMVTRCWYHCHHPSRECSYPDSIPSGYEVEDKNKNVPEMLEMMKVAQKKELRIHPKGISSKYTRRTKRISNKYKRREKQR